MRREIPLASEDACYSEAQRNPSGGRGMRTEYRIHAPDGACFVLAAFAVRMRIMPFFCRRGKEIGPKDQKRCRVCTQIASIGVFGADAAI